MVGGRSINSGLTPQKSKRFKCLLAILRTVFETEAETLILPLAFDLTEKVQTLILPLVIENCPDYCSRRIGISCLSLAFRPIGLFCFYLCNTIHPRLCIAAENK